jgi:formylglycine-generating enzyme required for sulfatase activity
MNSTTLRDLSRAYAVGALDRETYRRQRRELLTRIVAGQLPVLPYQAPEPEQRTVFPYDDDDGDTTQEILTPQPANKKAPVARQRKLPLLAALGALALGGAAAFYLLYSREVTTPTAPVVTSTSAASVNDPLAEFLSANQWDGPQLEALGTRWDALDETARARLRDAPSMRRLTEKALEQIQAENALITLGDAEEALTTQQQLLDVMDRLGAEDARLRHAREAWRKASEEFAHKRVADAQLKAASAAAATVPAPAANEPPVVALPAEAAVPAVPAAPATTVPVTIAATPAALGASTAAPPAPPENAAKAQPQRGNCKASLAKTRRPYCQDLLSGIGKGPALVVLPAGQFVMGGEAQEELPRHTVKFEQPFAIGLFEVSAAEFAQFCTATNTACPAQPWSDPALPVVNVSWPAASAYVQWLSTVSGASYRLPSEAEWEYAARAGSTTPYPFGNEILPTHARYSFKIAETTPLAANDRSVNRNDFKLYHMLGNVREWVADGWNANYGNASGDGRAQNGSDGRHVVRGGSYADRASALRSAARLPLDGHGDQYTGFRVVRTVN